MRQRLLLAAVAAIAFGGLAMGQAGQDMKTDKDSTAWSAPKSTATTQPMTPQMFIEAAARANNLDLQVADRAIEAASEPQVKELANSLKNQHDQSRQVLKAIAERKNLTFNEDLQPEQKQKLDQLKDQPKEQFTKAFFQQQLASYQDCITKYGKIGQSLQDPELKTFAESQAKKLGDSVSRLQSVASAVGIDTSSMAQPAGAKLQPGQQQPDQPMQPGDQEMKDKPVDKQ